MPHIDPLHLVFALLAAYGIGLAKTGIAGVGIISVALFSIVFPGKPALGIVLPLLIVADSIAVMLYRRHAVWSHLWRLFPWAGLGIVLGAVAVKHVDNRHVAQMVGWLLIFLMALQIGQKVYDKLRRDEETEKDLQAPGFLATGGLVTITLGILAGFATMVGNAAGPLMILYLLAARLPKMEFVGTGAWYYFVLNVVKLPFSLHAGLMDLHTLQVDVLLVPAVLVGAASGRPILKRINQAAFEAVAVVLTAAAAVKLILTA